MLGLPFLLMKDRRYAGYIQVTVQGSRFLDTTLIPAGPDAMMRVTQQVNYARAVAAAA
ncbi:hypothetical protein MAHJHV45_23080 [Mycobacterium avium subsp. hominissuis]|uniref:hypothetical protein n=1 Tax=Mycobacterium avium TaxID=1764 RepID=UPI0003920E10|nr:hypothetical protein [Mycobacterium avium]BAN33320.1 hypothetical protein MAH_4246 [Mycobacterium avium subsp. hominissuis TH135]